jgi:hypothetical protein
MQEKNLSIVTGGFLNEFQGHKRLSVSVSRVKTVTVEPLKLNIERNILELVINFVEDHQLIKNLY